MRINVKFHESHVAQRLDQLHRVKETHNLFITPLRKNWANKGIKTIMIEVFLTVEFKLTSLANSFFLLPIKGKLKVES
jgi:hypothetical protein